MGAKAGARLRSCTRKVRHDTRESAIQQLNELWQRVRYKGHAYHCSFCGGYHVGRKRSPQR